MHICYVLYQVTLNLVLLWTFCIGEQTVW